MAKVLAAAQEYVPPSAFDITKGRFQSGVFYGIVGLHLAAILALVYEIPRLPGVFSWTLLYTALVSFFGPLLGVTLGFHRGASHEGFLWADNWIGQTTRFVILLLAHLAFQKDIIEWVKMHRPHHAFVESPGDPHSPMRYSKFNQRAGEYRPTLRGILWSHVGSFFYEFIVPPRGKNPSPQEEGMSFEERQAFRRTEWVGDLEADPMCRWFERHYNRILVARFVVPTAVMGLHGYLTAGPAGALSEAIDGLLIAGIVTIVILWNVTWCTNSLAHLVGGYIEEFSIRRRSGLSRNIGILFAVMFGENWHNFHHALARCVAHGWGKKLDVTKFAIWTLEQLRLIYDVQWLRDERQRIMAKIEADSQRRREEAAESQAA